MFLLPWIASRECASCIWGSARGGARVWARGLGVRVEVGEGWGEWWPRRASAYTLARQPQSLAAGAFSAAPLVPRVRAAKRPRPMWAAHAGAHTCRARTSTRTR